MEGNSRINRNPFHCTTKSFWFSVCRVRGPSHRNPWSVGSCITSLVGANAEPTALMEGYQLSHSMQAPTVWWDSPWQANERREIGKLLLPPPPPPLFARSGGAEDLHRVILRVLFSSKWKEHVQLIAKKEQQKQVCTYAHGGAEHLLRSRVQQVRFTTLVRYSLLLGNINRRDVIRRFLSFEILDLLSFGLLFCVIF